LVLVALVGLFALGFQVFLLGPLHLWVLDHLEDLTVLEVLKGQPGLGILWLLFHPESLEFQEYQVVLEVPKDPVVLVALVAHQVLVALLLLLALELQWLPEALPAQLVLVILGFLAPLCQLQPQVRQAFPPLLLDLEVLLLPCLLLDLEVLMVQAVLEVLLVLLLL
jgi:hypothetical protein